MNLYAIDFGTSNSLLVLAKQDEKEPVEAPLDPLAVDPRIFRSLLYFPSASQVFYGVEAIKKFEENQSQGRLIRSIKRQLPKRNFVGTWIENRPVNLEDLIGFFLAEVRRRANKHFHLELDSVVLGRPVRFSSDDAEDNLAACRLIESAKRAGFKNIELFPEPLAAAYEFRQGLTSEKLVLVCDFGGGTSDFTVVKMGNRAFHSSDVLSMGGVPIAGDALDGSVMRHHLVKDFGSEVEYTVPFGTNRIRMPAHLMEKLCSSSDLSLLMKKDVTAFFEQINRWVTRPVDRIALGRLFCLLEDQLGFYVFEEIDRVKRQLSDAVTSTIKLYYPGLDIERKLTRKQFQEFNSSQLEAIVNALDSTLLDAKVKAGEIDLVCATGGTAKVPAIKQELLHRFGVEKVMQHGHFHSVVRGLGLRAKELR